MNVKNTIYINKLNEKYYLNFLVRMPLLNISERNCRSSKASIMYHAIVNDVLKMYEAFPYSKMAIFFFWNLVLDQYAYILRVNKKLKSTIEHKTSPSWHVCQVYNQHEVPICFAIYDWIWIIKSSPIYHCS